MFTFLILRTGRRSCFIVGGGWGWGGVLEGGAGRDGTEPIGWRDVGALCRSGDEDLFEALPEGVLKKEEKIFFKKRGGDFF